MRSLLCLVLCSCTVQAAPATGAVVGQVKVEGGSPQAIVVSLSGVPERAVGHDAKSPAMAQRGLAFEPRVMVVEKGTTVDFPNEDKVFHNVFSLSRGNQFDLQLYKAGTSKSVQLKRAGVVDVYCNIHPQMAA